MTFKVGDRVRVISDSYGKEQFGKTGIVDEVNRQGDLDVQIEYDTPLKGLKKNQYRSEHLELIARAGPIVTETVQRIEPGVYGRLWVAGERSGKIAVSVTSPNPEDNHMAWGLTASELRELARVALEIAEYLEHVD